MNSALLQHHRSSAASEGLWPYGADSGYNTEGDIVPRVTETVDSVDLNRIWRDMQDAIDVWNQHRSKLVDVLSFWTTSIADAISQGVSTTEFELATEYGEPVAGRPPSKHALLGHQFDDFDLAARYTWKFLRDADSRQVLAVHNDALNADNRLVTGTILQRLFSPGIVSNEAGHPCVGLWANDAIKAPPYNGVEFPSDHTHYLVSGNTDIDSGDIETAIKKVREHGYGLIDSPQKLLLLVNEAESEKIQSFRAGQENLNGQTARYDFIPAVNQPTFVLQGGGQLVGEQPPGEVFSLPTVGSYGPVHVIESSFIPAGYFALVASAGPGAPDNIVGAREHPNATYRGFRQISGTLTGYPLQDSFYSRAFGTGVRHRGAGVVFQLKAPGTYETPDIPGASSTLFA